MKNTLIILPFLIMCCTPLIAQQKQEKQDSAYSIKYRSIEDIRFDRGHWSLRFTSLFSKGQVNHQYGTRLMENPTGFAMAGGIDYTENFGKHWGIRIGFMRGELPVRIKFEHVLVSQNPQFRLSHSNTARIEMWTFPIEVVYRSFLNPQWIWDIRAGVAFRSIPLDAFTVSVSVGDDDTDRQIFVFENYLDSNQYYATFNIGVGISRVLWDNNLLNLHLVANISPNSLMPPAPPPGRSYYYFWDENGLPESYGTFDTKGSYIGLELGYTFTRANKRIREALRKTKRQSETRL
jgi:hypothetical protein